MRLIVVDEHHHFSQQTHAYAEYRAFSGLAGTDDRARAVTVTLERRHAADAEGSVICTVTVMTGGGEAREVRAIGQHACAAIDRAVSLIRQSHPVASGPVLPRRSPDTAGKRVIDRRRSRSFQGERSVTIRPDEQGGRYDEGGP